MDVRIRRVIKGRETRKVIPAIIVAHAYLRDDHDMTLVLTPTEKGVYALRWAASNVPLAARCEPAVAVAAQH